MLNWNQTLILKMATWDYTWFFSYLYIHSPAAEANFNRLELFVSLTYSLPLEDKSKSRQNGDIIEAEDCGKGSGV